MNIPPIVQRHPALRWLAPVGVVCVAGLAATGVFNADASSESLPRTTPAALIAAVQQSDVEGFSGTVVSQLSLGLPALPSIGNTGDGTSFTSLLSGSHTLQVWYGGAGKQRVALLSPTDETDVFRNGDDVWQWSSADRVAVHTDLPGLPEDPGHDSGSPAASSLSPSLTPIEAAHRALGALDPSTEVELDGDETIADRSAYQLVLTPRSGTTKVGSVHIAVDGDTKIPLGVQVYPRGSTDPALDIAFTSIRFAPQSPRNFVFAPPPGATVHDERAGGSAADSPSTAPTTSAPRTGSPTDHPTRSGSGWATVFGLRPGKSTIAKLDAGPFGKALTQVSGSWGKGRLLDSALVSLLVTDDGRVYVGAVDPSELFAAAQSK